MRAGWALIKISDLLTIQNGYAFDSKSFSVSKGTPLIRIRDLKNGRDTETRYSGPFDKRYEIKAGDFLIGMDGEFGCYEWKGHKALLNQRVCRLQAFSEKLEPKFLFYGINKYLKEIEDTTTYTTVKHLSSGQISNIEIPLPPRSEQRRIVSILDDAFTGLAAATANAEKNLRDAHELFEAVLASIFDQKKPLRMLANYGARATNGAPSDPSEKPINNADAASASRTGGRAATTRHIEGERSLSVGMPTSGARDGWKWCALDLLARMESGHTPSRRHPEYWGGETPWIGIRDAKGAHGREIFETLENTNPLGLENSSARLLPANTVCLSRTASVGYVTIMGRSMATSQDFVNWVCSDQLDPHFLMYLLMAQGDEIFKFSSGAVHQTIYFPEAKAFHICLPPVSKQREIIDLLSALKKQTERLEEIYQKKLLNLSDVKRSILQKAFSGDLTSGLPNTDAVRFPPQPNMATASFAANILAVAYERHRTAGRERTFGHKKAQKLLHLVEAVAGIDLGRDPIKDAAGPNDFNHMLRSTDWAEERRFFKFNKSDKRYIFERLENYQQGLEAAKNEIETSSADIHKVIDLVLPMNSEDVEILATVYAAWNNLMIKSMPIDEEAIVREAREDWHPEKMNISRHKFFDAISLLKREQVIPTGQAKLVREKYLL